MSAKDVDERVHLPLWDKTTKVEPIEDVLCASTPATAAAAAVVEESSGALHSAKTTSIPAEYLQSKFSYILERLNEMHGQLDTTNQALVTNDLLVRLANSLMSDLIYEIVLTLMEIQQTAENYLLEVREKVETDHQEQVQEWIVKITDSEELDHILTLMQIKKTKALHEADTKIIEMLDQKVREQQAVLQNAGVAGFHITQNPEDIKVQMFLLDCILRLSRYRYPQYHD